MKSQFLWLLAFVAIPALNADARLIELWEYERLMDESDLVIVGTVESAGDFDGTTEIRLFGDVLEPQLTTFKVTGVLKGELEPKTLELVHCRMRENVGGVRNGPLLAHFESAGRTIRIESGGHAGTLVQENQPAYLLFLKRRNDGRYEPVAGQVDSEMSVRKLTSAFGF